MGGEFRRGCETNAIHRRRRLTKKTQHIRVLPVAGSPTMIMTSLSLAVVPMTSRGVAFSPSGRRWGIGLSILGGGPLKQCRSACAERASIDMMRNVCLGKCSEALEWKEVRLPSCVLCVVVCLSVGVSEERRRLV
jgi:hypothetical protein